ncbi:DUF1565 domain-containing protein, partial [Candidatus Bathyarchaeota archaeon]|nr:DUF1565 domain-containing protein [Candidatus Bathyarchaeota archaeon]
ASSNNNTITGNTITNGNQAILFTTSTYNTLRNNQLFNNEHHFSIEHGQCNVRVEISPQESHKLPPF